MYLLSHFHEGHRPMTVGVAETLEIMCNLIFTQIKEKYHNAWIMKSLLEKKEKPVPEDILHFLSWAVHTMRFTHSADTRINSILVGRCSKVIAKCSCDSVLLSLIHYFTCQLWTTIVHQKTLSLWLKLTGFFPLLFQARVFLCSLLSWLFWINLWSMLVMQDSSAQTRWKQVEILRVFLF